jgi:hypothetical protein
MPPVWFLGEEVFELSDWNPFESEASADSEDKSSEKEGATAPEK